MHRNAEELFKKYGIDTIKPGMDVFEIGPERQVYTKRNIDLNLGKNNYNYFYTDLFKEQMEKIVNDHWGIRSTEIDTSDMPHFIPMIDENKFDCKDNRFDIVFSTNVIEHVRMPWIWLKEIYRIIKPGGYVIKMCPGITTAYHESPIDCWRIWPEGFNSLLTYAGFEDIRGTTEHLIKETDGMAHLDTIAIGVKPKNG